MVHSLEWLSKYKTVGVVRFVRLALIKAEDTNMTVVLVFSYCNYLAWLRKSMIL
jgi:hypothetical protein